MSPVAYEPDALAFTFKVLLMPPVISVNMSLAITMVT
jgi:hypothetical protein